jgi:hypothetical protein
VVEDLDRLQLVEVEQGRERHLLWSEAKGTRRRSAGVAVRPRRNVPHQIPWPRSRKLVPGAHVKRKMAILQLDVAVHFRYSVKTELSGIVHISDRVTAKKVETYSRKERYIRGIME